MDAYTTEIRDGLSKLSPRLRVLFGILTSEKLYPNYVKFQELTGWGNQSVLTDVMIMLYHYVFSKDGFDAAYLKEMMESLDDVTPHTKNFDSILVSFALDACTSIYSTLNYIVTSDLEDIFAVASYPLDTVDMFIQEVENLDYNKDPLFEQKIENSPFMIREKARQRMLIEKLNLLTTNEIESDIVEYLRESGPIIDLESLEL